MGFLYETHMHSSEVSRCARVSAVNQVKKYKKMGYTGIILTDHFTNGYTNCPYHLSWKDKMLFTMSGYKKAKKEGDKLGLDVFFGWEYTIRGSDFLTYGLDLDFLLAHPGLDRFSIEKYSETVRRNGGFLAQAHPYKDDFYVEYQFPVDSKYIDAVEVYNSSISDRVNNKALIFANNHNLPIQAGSDSHGRVDEVLCGIELNKKAESVFDIINAIKNRDIKIVK